jgi:hypothetical protein
MGSLAPGVLCHFVRIAGGNDVRNLQLLTSHQRVCRISHQVQHDASIQVQQGLSLIAGGLIFPPLILARFFRRCLKGDFSHELLPSS